MVYSDLYNSYGGFRYILAVIYSLQNTASQGLLLL